MSKTSVEIPQLSKVPKLLRKAQRKAVRKLAEGAPKEITDNLRHGLKPDGTAQPSNRASTREQKSRRGQGNVPGVATGTMAEPGNWRVTHQGSESRVDLPVDRQRVPDYLRAAGYEFTGIPPKTKRRADDLLKREADRALSNLPTEVIT